MEDLPLGRIAALVPEFAVKVLSLGRTLMMIWNTYSFYIDVSNKLNIGQVQEGHISMYFSQ